MYNKENNNYKIDETASVTNDKKPLTITVENDLGLAPASIQISFQATFEGPPPTAFNFKMNDSIKINPDHTTYTIPLGKLADALTSEKEEFAEIIANLSKNPSFPTTFLLTPVITDKDFSAVAKKANGSLQVTIETVPGDAVPQPVPATALPERSTSISINRPPVPSTHANSSQSRKPAVVPGRDVNLDRSAYRPTLPANLPPLPAPTPRPAPPKPTSSPKPPTTINPAARNPAKPAAAKPASEPDKADPADKDSDGKWRWPWRRQS